MGTWSGGERFGGVESEFEVDVAILWGFLVGKWVFCGWGNFAGIFLGILNVFGRFQL
jgi:hypothetical protein